MKIGQLATATGMSTGTIRYYESEGVVPPPVRTDSGYRVYAADDIQRLDFVSKAKRLGLSLREIKGILQVHDRDEPTRGHVRSLMDEKLEQIDATMAELAELRTRLVALRGRDGDTEDGRPTGGQICSIIEDV